MREPINRKQRKRILKRDGKRCVICWRKHGLTIHHHTILNAPDCMKKNGFPDISMNLPYVETEDHDLVTLCMSCHGKIETCDKRSPFYQFVTNYLIQITKGETET